MEAEDIGTIREKDELVSEEHLSSDIGQGAGVESTATKETEATRNQEKQPMEAEVIGTIRVKSEPISKELSSSDIGQGAGVESTATKETGATRNQEEMEAEVIGTIRVKSERISEEPSSSDIGQGAGVESTATKETGKTRNQEEQPMEAEVIGTIRVKSEPISEEPSSSDIGQGAGVESTATKETGKTRNQEEQPMEAEVIGTIRVKSEPISDESSLRSDAPQVESNSAKAKGKKQNESLTIKLVNIGTLVVKSEPISEETSRTNGNASEIAPMSEDEASVVPDPPQPPTISLPNGENNSTSVVENLLAAAERNYSTRINPEVEEMDQVPPDSFFADLLESAGDIRTAALTPPPYTPDALVSTPTHTPSVRVKNEVDDLPANFFDELLVDRIAERVEDAVFAGGNDELETKYSLKLKELQKLKDKAHKKHKKTKKKSRKRSRSRSKDRSRSRSTEYLRKRSRHSQSPSDRRRSRSSSRRQRSRSPSRHANKPVSVKSEMDLIAPSNYGSLPRANMSERPTSSIYQDLDAVPLRNPIANDGDGSSFGGFKLIKLEKLSQDVPPVANDEPEIVLTPKMKRQNSMKRTIDVIEAFRNAQKKPDTQLSTFLYTSTVRKLPASSSYVTQQIYENRSPLHTVNNVSYKFNSHVTRFNFQELGLEALSNTVSKVAKVLGCNADMISAKLKSAKVPIKMQRIKSELNEHGETLEETRSSFFTNAMTQTDDVTIISERRSNTASMGVQARPTCGSIGTQTTAAFTPQSSSSNGDLPLMKMIEELNENQLLALSDFAELIREPASNAMDMYRLRQRMLDIYKCSRLPSAMAAEPYAPSIHEVRPPQVPVMHHPHSTNNISVGDPRTRTYINDPRQRSTINTQQQQRAHHYAGAPPPQQHSVSRTYQRSSQVPPTAPVELPQKYFGRGGMRR